MGATIPMDSNSAMNRYELHYLRDINRLLGGGIKQAVGADGMASRQLWCMQQLVASMAAERNAAGETRKRLLAQCREQLPLLREVISEPTLLANLERHCRAEAIPELANDIARIAAALAASPDPRATALLTQLVDLDVARWTGIDAEVARLSAPATVPDRETDPFNSEQRARLAELLRKQCGEGPDLAITKVQALAGGFSKQTIMITLTGNQVLPAEVVVRRDRADSPVGSTVIDEFELLKSLHQSGMAVPRPFAIDKGSVIGDPIMIVSRIDGRNIGDTYDMYDLGCPGAVLTLAVQLARLHRIPLSKLTRPLSGHDKSQDEHLRGDIEEFRSHWQAQGESSIVIEAAFKSLDARFASLPTEGRCITHRDMRFHNILVDANGVTAILDWETAAVGRPARDLGYVYRHIRQLGDWSRFIDAYGEAGGEIPSDEELDFYRLWADLLMTIWMYRARASYLASGGGNIQLAFAGERMRQHNLSILAETLRDVLRTT